MIRAEFIQQRLNSLSRLMVVGFAIALLTSVTLPLSLFVGSASAFVGGDGSPETPYQISDCVQLQNIDESRDDNYELVNDIDCSGTVEWNEGAGFWPIAEGSAFTGSLNGNGHIISGLYINRPNDSNIGIFSETAHGGTNITNFGLENVDITGREYVGAVVGSHGSADSNGPLISQIFVTGSVTSYVSAAGAIAGKNYATIEYSYARASVATDSYDIGGLVGYSQDATLRQSYSAGTVTSEGGTPFGLVGWSAGETLIEQSFWDQEVSGISQGSGPTPSGYGRGTAAMKDINTYTSDLSDSDDTPWDFGDTWAIYSNYNEGYPCLQWDSNCAPEDVEEPGEGSSEDLNGDGISDSEQDNVVAVKSINDKNVVLEVDDLCQVNEALVKSEAVNVVQDSGYSYPEGLLNFTVDCGDPGYTTIVKQYYYGTIQPGLSVRKFNPVTNAYFNIANSQLSVQAINNQSVTVLSFSIEDGGELDIDGEVNGVIVDPSGLASQEIGSPNTGVGGVRELLFVNK